MSFEVHGHRGARAVLPENTLEGIRHALSLGVDAVEIDVALTKDKIPVVVHDRSLNTTLYRRKTARGLEVLQDQPWIKDLDLAELASIDVGSVRHSDFPRQRTLENARIPTLDAFVALMMSDPNEAILNIEIKTHPLGAEENLPAEDFAREILKVLARHGVPRERVLLQSFDPAAILALKALDPVWKCSFLVDAWSDDLPDVTREIGAEALSPRHDVLDTSRMKGLRDAALDVYVWTANTEADWKRLAELGVDGIITDDPEACLAFRATL
jgi:glycerophosphoryl diester phosphodiesterase